jgi:hypothetical protein
MKNRISVTALSSLIAWGAGVTALVLVAVAESPSWYLSHPLEAIERGLSGSITRVLPSVVLLACAAWAWPGRVSTALCAAIAAAWMVLRFAWWAHNTVTYDGAIPWWGFEPQFLFILPGPLASALGFARAFHALNRRRLARAGAGRALAASP